MIQRRSLKPDERTEDERLGEQILSESLEGDDLVADLERLGFVYTDEKHPNRQVTNRKALYLRLVDLARMQAVEPVELLRFACGKLMARRVGAEDRTRMVAAMVHRGLPEGFEDYYRRYDEQVDHDDDDDDD